MENAADALKMAAAVLVFVVALSISINAFGRVRKTSQTILDYRDREYDYEYVEENIDDSGNVLTERLVGMESIIPTIYKAYKENYKIVFEDLTLYQKKDSITGMFNDINYIDLQREALAGGEEQKRIFITAIIYGRAGEYSKDWDKIKEEFLNLGIRFTNEYGIYDEIKNSKYIEKLGEYYQEEVDSEEGQSDSTPDANKTKKRIITYSK